MNGRFSDISGGSIWKEALPLCSLAVLPALPRQHIEVAEGPAVKMQRGSASFQIDPPEMSENRPFMGGQESE